MVNNAIPEVIKLLDSNDWRFKLEAVEILSNMSAESERHSNLQYQYFSVKSKGKASRRLKTPFQRLVIYWRTATQMFNQVLRRPWSNYQKKVICSFIRTLSTAVGIFIYCR